MFENNFKNQVKKYLVDTIDLYPFNEEDIDCIINYNFRENVDILDGETVFAVHYMISYNYDENDKINKIVELKVETKVDFIVKTDNLCIITDKDSDCIKYINPEYNGIIGKQGDFIGNPNNYNNAIFKILLKNTKLNPGSILPEYNSDYFIKNMFGQLNITRAKDYVKWEFRLDKNSKKFHRPCYDIINQYDNMKIFGIKIPRKKFVGMQILFSSLEAPCPNSNYGSATKCEVDLTKYLHTFNKDKDIKIMC